MSRAVVRVWTLEKDNLAQGGSECKFYRCYHVGNDYSVIQYGSQRNGRSGGSFKVEHNLDYAVNQRDKKRRDGYVDVAGEFNVTFEIDGDKFRQQLLNGDKAAGEWLDNIRAAKMRAGARLPQSATSTFVCTMCQATFAQALALNRHIAKAHQNVTGAAVTPQAPDIPASVADRLTVLTDRALQAIAAAADDPAKVMVEYVSLKEERDLVALDLRKADSYLMTLETLVEEAVTA